MTDLWQGPSFPAVFKNMAAVSIPDSHKIPKYVRFMFWTETIGANFVDTMIFRKGFLIFLVRVVKAV